MYNETRTSLLAHLIAIIALPLNVTVVIPALLLYFFRFNIGWGVKGLLFSMVLILGVVFTLCGLLLLVLTVKLFITVGKGTLAPWDPPKKLVIDGPYRFTRNPMISAVVFVLCGEMIILGSLAVLLWLLLFTATNILYISYREEPGLEKKFGKEYIDYKNRVPRIFPVKLFDGQ